MVKRLEMAVAQSVPVSKLKASLSSYLDRVKAGEDIVVTEHGKAIARVVPFTRGGPTPAELDDLVRAGIIRLPKKTGPLPASFWENRPEDPQGHVLRTLLQEREEAPY